MMKVKLSYIKLMNDNLTQKIESLMILDRDGDLQNQMMMLE